MDGLDVLCQGLLIYKAFAAAVVRAGESGQGGGVVSVHVSTQVSFMPKAFPAALVLAGEGGRVDILHVCV